MLSYWRVDPNTFQIPPDQKLGSNGSAQPHLAGPTGCPGRTGNLHPAQLHRLDGFCHGKFRCFTNQMWSDSRIFVLLKRENGTDMDSINRNKRETVRGKTEIDQVSV